MRLTLLLIMLFSTLGCTGGSVAKPKVIPTKGTINFRGKPLPNAIVEFWSTKSTLPSRGESNDQGQFVLGTYAKDDGAIPGENKVTVRLVSSGGADGPMVMDPASIGKASTTKAAAPGGATKEAVQIPKLYSSPLETTVVVTVDDPGPNDLVVEFK